MAVPEHLVVDKKLLSRDVRPTTIKFYSWFINEGIIMFPFVCFALMIAFPFVAEFFILCLLWGYRYGKKKAIKRLDFKKPQTSQEKDPNQIHPGTGKPEKASGISYYGYNKDTGNQIWFANDDLRTHTLFFGTTGSGKTEALISLCANALTQCSGFIYVDGKGDSSLFMKLLSLVRGFLREDDFLIINYMTGGDFDPNVKTEETITNTMNPFSAGSASGLSELINSLLPKGQGGDDMWSGRAAIFMASLMRVLVDLRDQNKLLLDVNTIRNYFALDKLELLVNRDDIDPVKKEGLKDYVTNLPGYNPEEDEQEFDVLQQHGFITMQFTQIFGMLSDEYGHIMKTQLGEVDFFDVVVNRRILVVLLPALEKSQQSLTNLGKIIVASVRAMMASALGAKLEGSKKDVIDRKPTNGPSPYLTIFDEYGYYSTEGAAVMPAQARSLGFSMVFAGQDYQAFQKGSKEEAASIVANCAIKICMKLEDPTETFKIFQEAGGDDMIASGGNYQMQSDKVVDTGSVSLKEKKRFSIETLKAQGPGEAHIMFGKTVISSKMFFANPLELPNTRINTFLKVFPPHWEEAEEIKKALKLAKRQFRDNVEEISPYKTKINKVIKETGISSELMQAFNGMKVAYNMSSVISGFFASISYITKVKIIDNQVVEESSENLNEYKLSQNEKKERIEEELIDIDNIEEVEQETFEENIKQPGKSNFTKKLKEMIASKQKQISSKLTTHPFQKIKPQESVLHNNIKQLEKEVNQSLRNKGIYDIDDLLTEDYADLNAEKTLTDINASTSMEDKTENLEKRKEHNRQIVNEILNNIDEELED